MYCEERGRGRGRGARGVAVAFLACLVVMGILPLPAEGGSADDDLAVVKRGIQSPRPESPGSRPLWLKVRVVEKGARRAKVTVNLPLAVVRALGDDFPVGVGSRRLRLSEILTTLEGGGEPLVQVDDEQASVRVWVE